MRDKRDPQKLGERYLQLREGGVPREFAVQVPVPDYVDDVMSADPADHHSKTPQDTNLQEGA